MYLLKYVIQSYQSLPLKDCASSSVSHHTDIGRCMYWLRATNLSIFKKCSCLGVSLY